MHTTWMKVDQLTCNCHFSMGGNNHKFLHLFMWSVHFRPLLGTFAKDKIHFVHGKQTSLPTD